MTLWAVYQCYDTPARQRGEIISTHRSYAVALKRARQSTLLAVTEAPPLARKGQNLLMEDLTR